MVLRPGTNWASNAPEILCATLSGTGTTLGSLLAGLAVGGPLGAAVGTVIGAIASPAAHYALCGGYDSSDPLEGENQLPDPSREDFTFDLISTVISLPPKRIFTEDDLDLTKPPDDILEIGNIKGTVLVPNTVLPLYLAVSVEESIKNRKFGCLIHEPVNDDPITIRKCNLLDSSPKSDKEKENTASYLLGDSKSNNLGIGVAILSTIGSNFKVNTSLVCGPTDLSVLAANYAAINSQFIFPVQTKVKKTVESSDNCTVSSPSTNLELKVCNICDPKLDPFVSLEVKPVKDTNTGLDKFEVSGLVDGKGSPIISVVLQINGRPYPSLPPPFTSSTQNRDSIVKSYGFTVKVGIEDNIVPNGVNRFRLVARSLTGIGVYEKIDSPIDECFIPIRNLKDAIPGNTGYKTQLQIIFRDSNNKECRQITVPNPKDDLTASQIRIAVGDSVPFGNLKCEIDMKPYGYIRYYGTESDFARQLFDRLSTLSKGTLVREPRDTFRFSTRERSYAEVVGYPSRAVMFIFEEGKEPKCKRFNLK